MLFVLSSLYSILSFVVMYYHLSLLLQGGNLPLSATKNGRGTEFDTSFSEYDGTNSNCRVKTILLK